MALPLLPKWGKGKEFGIFLDLDGKTGSVWVKTEKIPRLKP